MTSHTIQIFWAVEIGYLINITLIKISMMLLYGRIFETLGWQRLVRYTMIICVVKVIAFLFPLIFQCQPINAIWDSSVKASCLDVTAISFVGTGISISEDLIFLVLPIPTLWGLKLDRARRILLIGLFSVGSL